MKKRLILLLCALGAVTGVVNAQVAPGAEEVAPGIVVAEEVRMSAQKSVQALGNEVLKGNFNYAVEKMYPRWKARQAARLGSEQKLIEEFNRAAAQMQEAGIDITQFKAQAPVAFYRVWPEVKAGVTNVRGEQDMVYHVVAIVPTKMTLRFLFEGKPPRTFERSSFQVAVAKEGTNDWTFLDGTTLKVTDLRSIFPLLPRNMIIPVKEDKEIK